MEILLGKAVILALAYFAVKFYWDKRELENRLYLSEHVFLEAHKETPIEDWFKTEGSKPLSARKAKAAK